MKLLIQPGEGIAPLVTGIAKAKKSIEIVIFRFDRTELEKALGDAVKRGVAVHALIAFTNRGGDKKLRELETRLLAKGITVARTDDDLVRYHGKMMIVDRKELYLLAFNFTYLDIDRSRSFGIITKNRTLVQEAIKLFECDTKRRTYAGSCAKFLVSPVNARKQLGAFLKGAKKELFIYDLQVSDPSMIKTLEERAKSGVSIRIIGGAARALRQADVRKLQRLRLHARVIIRDRKQVFLGSQSLRKLELDERREIGIIFRDMKIANSLIKCFESDWTGSKSKLENVKPRKAAKKVARAVVRGLDPVAPVVEKVVREMVGHAGQVDLDHKKVQETVEDVVEEAVKTAVKNVVENAVNGKSSNKTK